LSHLTWKMRDDKFEFSESRGTFYPGFCEAKEIRMMRVDEITEGSRMKWLENRI